MKISAGKILLGVGAVALFFWGRAAFAQSTKAGSRGVTRDGTAGASPITPSNVAAEAKSGSAAKAKTAVTRSLLPAGAAAFQNPANTLADYKYRSTSGGIKQAPVRTDYRINPRTAFAFTQPVKPNGAAS